MTNGWLIQSTGAPPLSGFTGPFAVNNVWAMDVGRPNSEPCKISRTGDSIVGISINNGSVCNDAGDGYPALEINGNGDPNHSLRGIDISAYTELEGASSNQTGIYLNDASDVTIHSYVVALNGSGGSKSNGITITESATNRTQMIRVIASQLAGNSTSTGGSGCYLNNTISGECQTVPLSLVTQNTDYFYLGEGGVNGVSAPTVTSGNDILHLTANGVNGGGPTTPMRINGASGFIAVPFTFDSTVGGQQGFNPPVSAVVNLPACNSSSEGTHAVANDCNAVCTAGHPSCTSGGSVHCEMYCNQSGWVETGR